jgi:gamma-glutamylcyclotransferase
MKYFAYGSNMFYERLKRRVPSCKFYGIGVLKKYVLRFHKKSQDGSGKCNAYFTGQEKDAVIGVIYEIDVNDKSNLDSAEGLGNGYHEVLVELITNGNTLTAFIYAADTDAIDDKLTPYTWYKLYVLEGARQHKLPEYYIAKIEQTPSKPDTNKNREDENYQILNER